MGSRKAQAKEIFETVELLREYVVKRLFVQCPENNGRPPEVTFSQMRALHALHKAGTFTVKQVAEELAVSPASASAMIDRLVEMGLVLREHDAADRRMVNVRLSEQGTRVFTAHEAVLLSFFEELMDEIGEERTHAWLTVHRALRAGFERRLAAEAETSNQAGKSCGE